MGPVMLCTRLVVGKKENDKMTETMMTETVALTTR